MVSGQIQRLLGARSRGYCEKCRMSLLYVQSHIHHIDGHPKNNKLENLILLCPNCHSRFHMGKSKRELQSEGTLPPFEALARTNREIWKILFGTK